MNPSRPGDFCFGSSLIIDSISLVSCRMIQIVHFFLCYFWQIVSFKELFHLIKVIKFVGIKVFIIFFYYPFNSHGMSFLTLLICIFSNFLLLAWLESYWFLDTFERINFLFCWFSPLIFFLNFIDFCSNSYLYSCTLGLICSSFFS